MARIYQCGFETGSTSAGVEGTPGGTTSLSTTTVRSGVYALRCNPTAATGYRAFTPTVSQGEFWFRFYVRIATLPGVTIGLLSVYNALGKSAMIGIKLTSGGALQLFNLEDATQIGSDSSALSTDQWYCIEMSWDSTTLASTSVSARIDQAATFASGTANLISAPSNPRVGAGTDGTNSTCDLFIDDVAMNDTTSGIYSTYYFDGSDAAASDPNAVWTNEANIFDSEAVAPSTFATTTTAGDTTSNYVLAEGTNAPAVASTISSVRARIYADDTVTNSPSWGTYTTLSTPSGEGWTWAKVQALEVKVYRTSLADTCRANAAIYTDSLGALLGTPTWAAEGNAGATLEVYKVEIEVLSLSSETYYFDASDGGPTDADGAWTNDADAFDSSTSTTADYTGGSGGSDAVRFLKAEGTNAPASGASITKVRARFIGTINSLVVASAKIYTDGLGEVLGTVVNSGALSNSYTSYITLTEPTGGWTWAKVQALEVKLYLDDGGFGGEIGRVDIDVGFQNSWCGPGKIIHLAPDAAGSSTAWTTAGSAPSANNYENVNDYTVADAVAYNSSTTLGQEDFFNLAATTSELSAGATVNVVAVGSRQAGSAASLNAGFKVQVKSTSGGDVDQSVELIPTSTSWNTNMIVNGTRYQLVIYDLPGSSTTPWTKSDLDTAQIGYVITTDNTNSAFVGMLWLSVEFIEPTTLSILMSFPERRGVKILG